MEVIFIKDLRNQGKKGQIKTVKDGYGENFLIKNGYAVLKTKENMKKLEQQQAKAQKKDLENRQQAEILKEKLDKEVLEFTVKTGTGDRVFGSISVKQIKDALDAKNYKLEKRQIELTSPIASLGFHHVKINLYPKVEATIKIHVVK